MRWRGGIGTGFELIVSYVILQEDVMKQRVFNSSRAAVRALGHVLLPLVLGGLAAGGVLWLRMLVG